MRELNLPEMEVEKIPVNPMKNVWLGVTAENQKRADERIPILLQIPALVRFVSCEPLLEYTDLESYLDEYDPLGVELGGYTGTELAGLDWVIAGQENGPGARSCDINWIQNIVDQCNGASVPCFIKKPDIGIREFPEIRRN